MTQPCPSCDDLREQLAALTAARPAYPTQNIAEAKIARARAAAEKLDSGNQLHAESVRGLIRSYTQSRVNNGIAWRENAALREALRACEEYLDGQCRANLSNLQDPDTPVEVLPYIDPAPLLEQVRRAREGRVQETDAFNPPPIEGLLE